ncbi:hypothetical protein CROQUDRAFT_166491 [Cronartium quercuum f. sp. fusiforme G11]|uniref:Uncharacterized protein n=1 Tax=Cronartium quercuum f. sp. fusiforme G11 TaxID=708437 RepID=A0A9P6NBR6_9BASI|nr:hypothetical protein CROQUDRAFT_166491 [Cronartium quercuum f. sp. fusiforme G11]
MTLPEDHYPHNRHHPSLGPVHRDVVLRGPPHFSATPELMSQHRPHHILPSTNPQLYPTSAPPSYQYRTSANENTPCSPHFNQSNHSSPSSKSSALGTPSPSTRSTTNPSFATLLCSNLVPNHHPQKQNLPSLYCEPGALGRRSSETHEASGSSSFSPLVEHSPNDLDGEAYARRRLDVSNGPPPPILRTHQPPPQVKSIEIEPKTGRKIYEDENDPPIACHQLPCPSQPAPSSPSLES